MSDGQYASLPDVDAYLARIGISQAAEPTREFLDELVYAHQLSVPFEDLDIHEKHGEISLAIPDLFDKIVTRRRGGYCFEMNGLFAALLKALGYDVMPGYARVLLGPDPHPPIAHRVSLVRFDDGLYMADVGFGGPMPGFAIRIEEGFTRTEHGQTFAMQQFDEHWWNVCFTNTAGETAPVLRICTTPADDCDFEGLSFWLSQMPESGFRMNRMVNIRTEDGACSINNDVFTEHVRGQATDTKVESTEQLDQILAEKFGLENWR